MNLTFPPRVPGSRTLLQAATLFSMTACLADPDMDPAMPAIDLAASQSALFTDPDKTMVIVAHEDDDIALLNPDSLHTIAAGKAFQSLVLTAGDAEFNCPDENDYVKGREEGELAAYASMAGIPFDPDDPMAAWTASTPTLPGTGKTYRKYVLTARLNLSVIYLSIPNGDVGGLEDLWTAPNDTVTATTWRDSRRPVDTYTRKTFIATLLELINLFKPAHISTLDSSELFAPSYPLDHPDHIHSALFALAASQRYTTPHTLRMYRTYNPMFVEPANVSASETNTKLDLMEIYGAYDAWFPNQSNDFCPLGVVSICGDLSICQDPALVWPGFEARQYTSTPVQGSGSTPGSVGGIAGPSGKCLQASGTTAGSTVSLATCNMAVANQNWRMNADYTIRQKSSGLCITALGAGTAYRPRGIGLTLKACPATPAFEQQFFLTTDGQLRGPDATCVAAAGNALSIAECADTAAQLSFRPQGPTTSIPAVAAGFTDVEIPDLASAYRTLDLADIDNDADQDVCFRRTAGIYCSTYNGSSFAAPVLKLAQFTNPTYAADQYGATVQLADINKDGRADVCGRGPGGIFCANWSGATLGNYRQRSTAFTGYGTNASYYGSIRFPDVNGDGYADVCGRNSSGIECALNCGTSLTGACAANDGTGYFKAPTQWITSEFTDALDWDTEPYGSTLQFADIDGDGKTDVCGRGPNGIRCALHHKTASDPHFVESHLFGASDDYDDLTGWSLRRSAYWSIRLADVNGDGRADICGRRDSGLVCGISMGSSFGFSQRMLPVNPFNDATGWDVDRYGSTLMFADLNGDKHADVCGRGPLPGGGIGLRCALSP